MAIELTISRAQDFFEPLEAWQSFAGSAGGRPWLVYGGDQRQSRSRAEALPWRQIGELAAVASGP